MSTRAERATWAGSGVDRIVGGLALVWLLAAPPALAQQPIACVAPGSPLPVVDCGPSLFSSNGAGPLAANVEERWRTTATDGSGIARGEPITLTWSVVPDGTAIDGALEEPSAPSDLVAFLDGIYGNSTVWIPLMQEALDGWDSGPGMLFVYEPADDGPELNTSTGELGMRGDIRIGGHPIDGNYSTVAYAYFPDSGDMVIDTNDTFYTDGVTPAIDRLRLQNVIAHEAGHSIGLGHVCPDDETKLMEPSISTLFTGPQFDDLLGAHRSYGDSFEQNDDAAEAMDLGLVLDTVTDVQGIALDGTGDSDWYAVPSGGLSEVSIQLDPAGSPYDFAEFDPDPLVNGCGDLTSTTFDPRDVQDLTINLYESDGTTLVATSDASGLGGSESLADVRLSAFGGYIEVTQSAGVNDAQAYELEITLVPEPSRPALTGTALLSLAGLARARRRASARRV